MGQYHYIVNLDKKEFINPDELAVGRKAWEQLVSVPSTPQALFLLLLHPIYRGGGDLKPENYPNGEEVIGRWRGERIAVIGDYAKDQDLPGDLPAPVSQIYELCKSGVYKDVTYLVRPILAAEFEVEYYQEPWQLEEVDGQVTTHYSWDSRSLSTTASHSISYQLTSSK